MWGLLMTIRNKLRDKCQGAASAPAGAGDPRVGGLGERGLAILAYLQRRAQSEPLPPTREEIRVGTGIGSTATVQRWLLRLQQRGLVRLTPHVARGIRLHGPGSD